MALTARQMTAIAGLGSALLLGGAFAFQLAGYAPCHLCIVQRWPHAAAILIAVIAWFVWPRGRRALALLGAAAMVICAGIAFYHTGVEFKWWAGPSTCSGGAAAISQLSVEDLMAQIEGAPVIRCDQPALLILGFSMAAWNALFSLILAGVWAVAAKRA